MLLRCPWLAALIVLVSLSISCSSPQKQFARAQKLEAQGHTPQAIRLYSDLLERVPPQDARWRSQIQTRIGECYWREERLAESFGAFQKSVEIDPGNIVAHLRLGEIYLAAGAPETASEHARLVLEAAAENPEALSVLGAASAAAGNVDLAEKTFKRVLEADPGRVNVALALADLYNRLDRTEDARQTMKAAAAAQPGSSAPLLGLGRLEEQEGNGPAAEENYRLAVAAEDTPDTNLRLAQFLARASRIAEAEDVLRHVDGMRPELATALPDFEIITGRPAQALDGYLALLKQNSQPRSWRSKLLEPPKARKGPSERALIAVRGIEANLQAARSQTQSERHASVARARTDLDRYRGDLDPATLATVEAEIAIAADDLPMAAMRAATAVELAPQSPAAHYVLGMIKERTGDAATARAEWQTALENEASFVPARLALGHYALQSGDAGGAEEYVIQVVRDEPANFQALNLFARILLAQGRLTPAAMIVRRALAVDGKAAEPHLIMGEIDLRQDRLAEALVEFEQAILLQPHSQAAIEGLLRVYRMGKVNKTLLRHMEKIATTEPRSATLLEIAGRLYAEHGWHQDAQRCLSAALAVDPQRLSATSALAQTLAATGQLAAAADSAARLGGNSAALLSGFRAAERQDVNAAIRDYEAAVRQGDRSGMAANNLAWLLAEQGIKLDRALSLAQSARSLAPEDPAILDTLGVVHLRRREFSAAIEALKNAALLAANNKADHQLLAEIRRHLSEAYLRVGQPQAAALLARNADFNTVLRSGGLD
jgi:tetratricopeptide (TPR) repeat protein